MTQSLVSIIMPAFNEERHIGAAILSVCAQDYDNWELIIIDDGSNDKTVDTIRAVSDPRIKLVRATRGGVSRARNRGIEQCKGDYIVFLDADDCYAPCALSALVATLEEFPDAGLCYGSYVRIDESNQPLSIYRPPPATTLRDLLHGFPCTISITMVRRSWHNQTTGFDPNYIINEDRDYFVRLALAGCKMLRSDGAVVLRRVYSRRIESNLAKKMRDQEEILHGHWRRYDRQALRADELRSVEKSLFVEWSYQSSLADDRENLSYCLLRAEQCGALDSPASMSQLLSSWAEAATRNGADISASIKALDQLFGRLEGRWRSLQPQRIVAIQTACLLAAFRLAVWGREAEAQLCLANGYFSSNPVEREALWRLKWESDNVRSLLGNQSATLALASISRVAGTKLTLVGDVELLVERAQADSSSGWRQAGCRWLLFLRSLARSLHAKLQTKRLLAGFSSYHAKRNETVWDRDMLVRLERSYDQSLVKSDRRLLHESRHKDYLNNLIETQVRVSVAIRQQAKQRTPT